MTTHGSVAPGFEGVRDAFEKNFEDFDEAGASVAATVDGEMVVDLWGGTATYDHGAGDWERDTIVNVWSTTKTMAALCCLVLADRGELDPYAPIASYWPEFAAAGKEEVAARHVLSHSAGLAGWDVPIEPEDFLDHDKLVGLLAAQAPWWEPGTAPGYHAISQGYLLGEIVERITGRSLGTFFAEEIAGPLGADFHIGTGPEHDARIAHVIPPAVPSLVAADADPDSIAYRAMSNGSLDASFSQRHDWRRAEIPAAGGHGNARSVATVHTPTACGGTANGVTILSPEVVDRIFDEQVHGMDLVLGIDVRHGMGYGLPTTEMPFPHERTCFWGGWGGSLAIIDTESRLSFSYVMNKMGDGTTGDMRGFNLLVATFGALAARA
jgi:CubicO group peptidase (beta-lactamase class C family)